MVKIGRIRNELNLKNASLSLAFGKVGARSQTVGQKTLQAKDRISPFHIKKAV